MNRNLIVIDLEAVNIFNAMSPLPNEWFETFAIPNDVKDLTLRKVEGIPFILSKNASKNSRLFILSNHGKDVFNDLTSNIIWTAWERLTRVALSRYQSSVIIPTNWRPFHRGNKVSFQITSNSDFRACIDFNAMKSEHVFLFSLGKGSEGDLSVIDADYSLYQKAISLYDRALKSTPICDDKIPEDITSSFALENQLSYDVTKGRTFSEWYESHLTKEQRQFVDFGMSRSSRLKGAAGTGKTLALVVKFLKEIYQKLDHGESVRAIFLAHNWATVSLIEKFISFIDARGIIFSPPENTSITVTTLHDLANTHLQYDFDDIKPLALDGYEGRELQLELIQDVVEEYIQSDWITRSHNCPRNFKEILHAERDSQSNKMFCFDLMNEFACVLDTYGGKNIAEREEKYLKERRLKWMMPLETKQERLVVLDIYKRFRQKMREFGTIGIDQMVSDYLSYLESFKWDMLRTKDGFDFIFVDELHLFNRQERLAFHLLMNNPDAIPLVTMAYDPKQSPRDTFMDMPTRDDAPYQIWRDANLGKVEPFQVNEVFRYTPQINKFLSVLDQSFPAENFGEEWMTDFGKSLVEDGCIPSIKEMNNSIALYDEVFSQATKEARSMKNGKKVAVICLNDELFAKYLMAGQYKDNFIAVSSRDKISNISYAHKKFILSIPEYVAGLQFSTVYLIDVNQNCISLHGDGVNGKRRFVSNIYLGASRAESSLKMYANIEEGGIPNLLHQAIEQRVVTRE